jgi:hypothetical protein
MISRNVLAPEAPISRMMGKVFAANLSTVAVRAAAPSLVVAKANHREQHFDRGRIRSACQMGV